MVIIGSKQLKKVCLVLFKLDPSCVIVLRVLRGWPPIVGSV